MKTFTTTLLIADVPSANGRVYTREALEKAVEDFNNRKDVPMLGINGFPDTPGSITLSDESGGIKVSNQVVDMKMVGDKLMCEINLLETPMGVAAKDLIDRKLAVVRPVAMGVIGKNGVIDSMKITSCSVILKSEDAFNGIID